MTDQGEVSNIDFELGPSHLMFSFLLQILKLGGGHFSLFIIFAWIRT